ncbi:hypothetical protein BJ165DRAFT_1529313 [Panaeolus papilionaceus]|nr:hypothetical protein BJ165DRAFT_1529313 [Panaeolus papilionaceus]
MAANARLERVDANADGGTTGTRPPTTTTFTATGPITPTTLPVVPVPLYGQCGGLLYQGITTCAYPYKCTVYNEYYSQCL